MATAIPCARRATSATPVPIRWSRRATFRCELLETATRSRSAPGWSAEWRLRLLPAHELRTAAAESGRIAPNSRCSSTAIANSGWSDPPRGRDSSLRLSRMAARATARSWRGSALCRQKITTIDRLVLLLPVLMWIAAALITWLLVSRLLVRPLKRLERAVRGYRPGQSALDLPRKLGPRAGDPGASRRLRPRDRAGRRIRARDDRRRWKGSGALVREVHHRVKNNLQVDRLAAQHPRPQRGNRRRRASAYAGISRRVGALSIVHRNHFAEMEENRGIALRPLIAELAAELRAGAPEEARGLSIELDIETRLHDAGRRGRGRLPDHRDRRIRDAQCAARSRSSCRFGGPAN